MAIRREDNHTQPPLGRSWRENRSDSHSSYGGATSIPAGHGHPPTHYGSSHTSLRDYSRDTWSDEGYEYEYSEDEELDWYPYRRARRNDGEEHRNVHGSGDWTEFRTHRNNTDYEYEYPAAQQWGGVRRDDSYTNPTRHTLSSQDVRADRTPRNQEDHRNRRDRPWTDREPVQEPVRTWESDRQQRGPGVTWEMDLMDRESDRLPRGPRVTWEMDRHRNQQSSDWELDSRRDRSRSRDRSGRHRDRPGPYWEHDRSHDTSRPYWEHDRSHDMSRPYWEHDRSHDMSRPYGEQERRHKRSRPYGEQDGRQNRFDTYWEPERSHDMSGPYGERERRHERSKPYGEQEGRQDRFDIYWEHDGSQDRPHHDRGFDGFWDRPRRDMDWDTTVDLLTLEKDEAMAKDPIKFIEDWDGLVQCRIEQYEHDLLDNRPQRGRSPDGYESRDFRDRRDPDGYESRGVRDRRDPTGYESRGVRDRKDPTRCESRDFRDRRDTDGRESRDFRDRRDPTRYEEPDHIRDQEPKDREEGDLLDGQSLDSGDEHPGAGEHDLANVIQSADTDDSGAYLLDENEKDGFDWTRDSIKFLRVEETKRKKHTRGPILPYGLWPPSHRRRRTRTRLHRNWPDSPRTHQTVHRSRTRSRQSHPEQFREHPRLWRRARTRKLEVRFQRLGAQFRRSLHSAVHIG